MTLVEAMGRAEFYPNVPATIELRQTHISRVFLAGDLVYKLKKPVRFAFLDYSTLALRKHWCEEEVRLNRRLAPSVYRGVAAIVADGATFRLADEAPGGEVAEYAVVMRRLPEDRLLDHLVRAGRATEGDFRRIAERLVPFHRSASTASAERFGSPDAVAETIRENLSETRAFVGDTLRERDFRDIEAAARMFLESERGLLARRAASGRVRDGHGDLRAEHVCFEDDVLSIIDCVEFSERLRTCDVASELAFLVMDLDFLAAPELGEAFVRSYAALAEDPELERLVRFYACYRAEVRGKVESLKSREPEVSAVEAARARDDARRHFRLALRYARPPRRPALIVVGGLAGTGKTTTARRLGDLTGFCVFGSDPIRKELAAAGHPGDLYTASMTRRTYAELLRRADVALARGQGAIADATFRASGERAAAFELAARHGVTVALVECRASEAELRRRFAERRVRSDSFSDATWDVHVAQRGEPHSFADVPARNRFVIETDAGEEAVAETIDRLLDCLR